MWIILFCGMRGSAAGHAEAVFRFFIIYIRGWARTGAVSLRSIFNNGFCFSTGNFFYGRYCL